MLFELQSTAHLHQIYLPQARPLCPKRPLRILPRTLAKILPKTIKTINTTSKMRMISKISKAMKTISKT